MKTLNNQVAELLRASGLTLGVAESCSGGLLAKRLTDISGSSDYFLLGTVTYSNSAKENVLQVPGEILATHGAVSAETAAEMARGIRRLAGSDIGLATTGIAGPGGGTPAKPVGTVYISIADSKGCETLRFRFNGDRTQVRLKTVEMALNLLKDRLEPNLT
ncbi:MAG: CinA family protein [Geobacter sp.]|nr:CinA family protein [Geobacter sp.]